jgi:hypothetical protein
MQKPDRPRPVTACGQPAVGLWRFPCCLFLRVPHRKPSCLTPTAQPSRLPAPRRLWTLAATRATPRPSWLGCGRPRSASARRRYGRSGRTSFAAPARTARSRCLLSSLVLDLQSAGLQFTWAVVDDALGWGLVSGWPNAFYELGRPCPGAASEKKQGAAGLTCAPYPHAISRNVKLLQGIGPRQAHALIGPWMCVQVSPAQQQSAGDIQVFCMEPSLRNFANLVLTREAFFGAAPANVQW